MTCPEVSMAIETLACPNRLDTTTGFCCFYSETVAWKWRRL